MSLLSKKKEATINLLTSLTGIAWRQIEHVSEKLCDDEDGFGKAIKMLDACFQYDERVEMPRALERFFYQLQRRPEQTLLAYTSEHREQLREIEKYDIKLPSSVSGWLMLRRSGLTPEQRQMVQSQCGTSLDITKVEAAMFFLFGQDYRSRHDASSRWSNGKRVKTTVGKRSTTPTRPMTMIGMARLSMTRSLTRSMSKMMRTPLSMTGRTTEPMSLPMMRFHGPKMNSSQSTMHMKMDSMMRTTTRCTPPTLMPVDVLLTFELPEDIGMWLQYHLLDLQPRLLLATFNLEDLDQKEKEKEKEGRAKVAKDKGHSTKRALPQHELIQLLNVSSVDSPDIGVQNAPRMQVRAPVDLHPQARGSRQPKAMSTW